MSSRYLFDLDIICRQGKAAGLLYFITRFVILTVMLTPMGNVKVSAQEDTLKQQLLRVKSIEDSINKIYPAEKLYLQFNKSNYATGDTIWFKAYLFHAPTLALSAKSGVLYVDIADDKNNIVKHFKLPVKWGLSWGSISLNNFKAGNYTLRAFTNWMRNYTSNCFFYKKIFVGDLETDNLAVDNPVPLINRKANPGTLSLRATAAHFDLQFLPEGGSLVAGLPAHLGFKAIDENGKGIGVSGIVFDKEHKEVATFSDTHLGMGSFQLNVKPDEIYNARIKLPGNNIKDYPLPTVGNSGTVLGVDNLIDKDSVSVYVAATPDLAKPGDNYFLIAKSRNVICYAAILNFKDGGKTTRRIAKSLFPTGIAHFILTTTAGVPLNERLIFINHGDNLNINIQTNKSVYNVNDSISINISASTNSGRSSVANFSAAVTDDAQVTIDTLQDNIISHILLSSELKGYLEQPVYYLANNRQSAEAVDNLMLTQGWVNYSWQPNGKQPVYNADSGFTVKGKVTTSFNKLAKGAKVTLISNSPFILMDTLIDDKGYFVFGGFPIINNPVFILKAVNKHNRTFNVGIIMDDPQPPVFIPPLKFTTGAILSDTTLLLTAKNNRDRQDAIHFGPNMHMLREVTIRARKIIKSSKNLNGPGNADITLDEADLEKQRKKSWYKLLKENIKGFREGTYINPTTHGSSSEFYIGDKHFIAVIDGILYNSIYPFSGDSYEYFKQQESYLMSHNAEDIKGLEVFSSDKYSSTYSNYFGWPSFDYAFVEITTRSGNGPVISNTPGMYLYKPVGLTMPAEFYKPRYLAADTVTHLPDTRSAIDWEPYLNANTNGKASFWFYAADKPSTYTIIIEGTDANGNLGYKRQKITIGGKPVK